MTIKILSEIFMDKNSLNRSHLGCLSTSQNTNKQYGHLPMERDVLTGLFFTSISPPSAGGGAGSLRV